MAYFLLVDWNLILSQKMLSGEVKADMTPVTRYFCGFG